MPYFTHLFAASILLLGSAAAQSITVDKTSCREGGAFGGSLNRLSSGLQLDLAFQGPPNAVGFLVASPNGDTTPVNIGFRGCILLSTPTVITIFRTDSRGRAGRMTFPVPVVRVRVEVFLQIATIATIRTITGVGTSNTLKAVLVR